MQIPLQSRLPRTFRIAAVKRETEAVTTFTFRTTFGSKPGQFVMLWLPGTDEIPMSVAFDDGKGTFRVTFFAVGDMTKKLACLKKGDLVGLRGPFGTHYEWKKKQSIVLVAGGYGAAPMYFAAKESSMDGCTLDVIVGARSKEYLLFLREFKALPRTTLHIATDDGSEGHKGYVTDVLKDVLTAHRSPLDATRGKQLTALFACGPERMLVAVSDLCFREKIPCQLSLERYMKCGYGLCGNCVVDPLGIRLCCDGPVVRNETCRKIAEFGKYHRDALGRRCEF
ncbi:MAG: dihydroorotate dehydrogenase electron transfer subunit [Candidatus Peregrinibacteria bacterium]